MEQPFLIVGNQKDYLSVEKTISFLEELKRSIEQVKLDLRNKKMILCPSLLALGKASEFISQTSLPLHLGTQNVSEFEEGAHTGKISAAFVAEFAKYTLIGHSEVRRDQQESFDARAAKVNNAKKAGLEVIFCVPDAQDQVPEGVEYIAYEPPFAIGADKPDAPQNIKAVFEALHTTYPSAKLLYGGTVNDETVGEFHTIPLLSGFLIGRGSTDSTVFFRLLSQW